MTYGVVIPVYNGKDTIVRAVRSCLGQTVAPEKVVIVDDGSTDNTPKVVYDEFMVRPNPQIMLVSLPENKGRSAARNRGIRDLMMHADVSHIGFLDSDDWSYCYRFEHHLKAIGDRGSSAVAVSGRLHWWDEVNSVFLLDSHYSYPEVKGSSHAASIMSRGGVPACPSCMLVRADACVGDPFNVDFEPAEDFEFLLQLLQKGEYFNTRVVVGAYSVKPHASESISRQQERKQAAMHNHFKGQLR